MIEFWNLLHCGGGNLLLRLKIVNSGMLSRKEVAVPFRIEDLLAKFQNQSFSAISKAGNVKVLESRLVVLVVVTKDYFATAFLDTFKLVALLFCKGRVPDSASVFQNGPNVSLKTASMSSTGAPNLRRVYRINNCLPAWEIMFLTWTSHPRLFCISRPRSFVYQDHIECISSIKRQINFKSSRVFDLSIWHHLHTIIDMYRNKLDFVNIAFYLSIGSFCNQSHSCIIFRSRVTI